VWCGALTVLVFSTGCSNEPTLSEKYPTQWQTCNELFGAKNMESLRKILGPDDLAFTNRALSVRQLKESLTKEASQPYNEIKGFDEYNVCRISGDHRFSSTVSWSAASLKEVQSISGRWHRASADAYVADRSLMGQDIGIVFRCEIVSSSAGQQAQVLLEARVEEVTSRAFSETFHEQLAVGLARSLRDQLKCANQPDIPDRLGLDR
jgi:hypothetical protein